MHVSVWSGGRGGEGGFLGELDVFSIHVSSGIFFRGAGKSSHYTPFIHKVEQIKVKTDFVSNHSPFIYIVFTLA